MLIFIIITSCQSILKSREAAILSYDAFPGSGEFAIRLVILLKQGPPHNHIANDAFSSID